MHGQACEPGCRPGYRGGTAIMTKHESGMGKRIYDGVFVGAFALAAVGIVVHSSDAYAWSAKGGQDFCANPISLAGCALAKPVAVWINDAAKPVLQVFDLSREYIDGILGGKK